MSFKREYVAIFPNDAVSMSGKQHNTRQKATETELFACEERTGERPEDRDFQGNQTNRLLKNRSTCSPFLWTSKRLRALSKKGDVMSLMEKYCRPQSVAMQNSSRFQWACSHHIVVFEEGVTEKNPSSFLSKRKRGWKWQLFNFQPITDKYVTAHMII